MPEYLVNLRMDLETIVEAKNEEALREMLESEDGAMMFLDNGCIPVVTWAQCDDGEDGNA